MASLGAGCGGPWPRSPLYRTSDGRRTGLAVCHDIPGDSRSCVLRRVRSSRESHVLSAALPERSGPSLVCQQRRSTLTTHRSIARWWPSGHFASSGSSCRSQPIRRALDQQEPALCAGKSALGRNSDHGDRPPCSCHRRHARIALSGIGASCHLDDISLGGRQDRLSE